MNVDEITESIIGAAIEVHKELGPGMLESVYEACLAYELSRRGRRVLRQVRLPIKYKGLKTLCSLRSRWFLPQTVAFSSLN